MRIGILQTGRSPDSLRERHGDYDAMFRRLLDGHGFEFDTYPVLDGVIPENVRAADGWLITGSRFGAYEDHAWIPPLEAFLREAFAAGVPIVGVCFGHQILAQALGGRVEKFSGGWSVGATDYDTGGGEGGERMLAWHQDQVVEPPAAAEVIGHSDFCRYAMLAYGDRALTVQPHPEFTPEFLRDLVAVRGSILPAGVADAALADVDGPLTSKAFADRFAAFFRKNRAVA